MKVTYKIEGMSCEGCLRNVTRALKRVPEVTEVEVQLNPPNAIITMNKEIPLNAFQAELADVGDYVIKDITDGKPQ